MDLTVYREVITEYGLLAPSRIELAAGAADRLGASAREVSEPGPALVVTGGSSARTSGLLERLHRSLVRAGFSPVDPLYIAHEPVAGEINAAAERIRAESLELVVAVGGGSPIDTAKALAALATNPGDVEDYLEGVGRGWTVEHAPLPLVALPTTAGTGAEMTKNAVIADHQRGFKKSMRDARMIPAAALLDPLLTRTLPHEATAASGMDALTQLIEPCISAKRKPGPTALAHRALEGVRNALPAACETPDDLEAREAMLLAAGISGVCLANSGLALAHGIASGLGGLHPVPHGLVCGILLPHTLRHNRDACETELADALTRFLNEPEPRPDTIDRGIREIEALRDRIGVPASLRFLQLTREQVEAVAAASMGSSMSGNPVPMDPESTFAFLAPLCLG